MLFRSVFIPKGKMGNAFHNDLVEVKVDRARMATRVSGRITDVIERGMKKVVGRYSRGRGGPVLRVEDKKFSYHFDVFSTSVKGVKEGDVVEGLIEGKAKRGHGRGVWVVRKIGQVPDVEAITLSTIHLYEIGRAHV